MLGLNDYHIPRNPPRNFGEGSIGHELGDGDYVLRREPDLDEEALVPHVKHLFEDTPLRPEALFPVIYDLLIARPKGPKLTTLLATMGAERALPLLEPSLEAGFGDSGTS